MSDHGVFPPEPPILAPDPIWPAAWVDALLGLAEQAKVRAEAAPVSNAVEYYAVSLHAKALHRAIKIVEEMERT